MSGCLSGAAEWRDLSGDGEILSAVMFQRSYNKAYEAQVPYNVVLVQLVEGPRMFSNVLPLSSPPLPAGSAVRVTFDPITDEVAIPRFVLFSSRASTGGGPYVVEAAYPLE